MSPAATPSSSSALMTENEPAHTTTTRGARRVRARSLLLTTHETAAS